MNAGAAVLGLSGGLRDRRKLVLQAPGLNGIDYVEVDATDEASQKMVRVHLLKPADAALVPWLLAHPDAFRLATAGRDPPPRVKAVAAAPTPGPHLVLHLDKPGGFAQHTLHLQAKGVDPAFASVRLDFKAACPARFDCEAAPPPPAPETPAPRIDYETRDFAGFRALMLDRLRTLMPDWQGGSEADVAVTIVEQLAWAADRLSYMQDVVHTESYLDTCRQRTSLARHVRLVDHPLAEGTSAQTVLDLQVRAAVQLPVATPAYARIAPDPTRIEHGVVVRAHERDDAAARAGLVYETLHAADLHPACNLVRLHTWGLEPCDLPAGATQADLVGDLTGLVGPGKLLLFEETLDPRTAEPADADLRHRFLVRVTQATLHTDPLGGVKVTRVRWDRADALPCRLPLAGATSFGKPYHDATVVRANLVLADHGRTVEEKHLVPPRPPHASQQRAHRLKLGEAPLAYRQHVRANAPAAALARHDPALVRAEAVALLDDDVWEPGDLLAVDGQGTVVAVEPEEGEAWLRFGDGRLGRAPPAGSKLTVRYRVGNGPAGHVGHDALAHVAEPFQGALWAVEHVRNPVASWGGLAPESMEAARRDATEAFRVEPKRAVTEEDYGAVARLHPEVQQAVARFRWTGSWHTVFLYIDPLGRPDLDAALAARVEAWVHAFTQTGYDLEVRGPRPVPIELEIQACARRDHLAPDVEQAVRAALGSGLLPDGTQAFFHPDRHTFGQPLHLSAIVAAVERVEGVEMVRVASLRRGDGGPGPKDGRLDIGPLEVVRLDADPDRPDNGQLTVTVDGGSA
ncbi:MAG: hypothetical protein QOD77_281 [Thermoplasmata archaeon]|jgi:hypothetical protein|nr:hypothetical protein [Thermoplasmata archaeon]